MDVLITVVWIAVIAVMVPVVMFFCMYVWFGLLLLLRGRAKH